MTKTQSLCAQFLDSLLILGGIFVLVVTIVTGSSTNALGNNFFKPLVILEQKPNLYKNSLMRQRSCWFRLQSTSKVQTKSVASLNICQPRQFLCYQGKLRQLNQNKTWRMFFEKKQHICTPRMLQNSGTFYCMVEIMRRRVARKPGNDQALDCPVLPSNKKMATYVI